ncbi:MAG: SAM-dependent chlorinase/fluorinase [Pirellulales bacterium]|nr:SAM-dependent chlorinase/fluorinase [Pirellulales bacterium]
MSLVTLATDFGIGSPYVAAMKGVILSINPAVRLVDVSHNIAPQDIRHGAIVLAEATPWYPAETIHVGVVDPGVGTSRRLVYARIGDQQYLAPDNGLLSLLAKRNRPSRIVELANSEYWLPAVSNTFHGRDILAPIAAQLSLGLESERLGPQVNELQMLDWPQPRSVGNRIEGVVEWIDPFGNLITNVSADLLSAANRSAACKVTCGDAVVTGISTTYENRPRGATIALVGSGGKLEIAVVEGNATQKLNIIVGLPVVVEW